MQSAQSGEREQPRASVARNAGVISLAVMASRVLGLVRDQVFAIFFGAGLLYDAFLTAFRIPNLLRDLLAEGALSAAFVTTFTQTLASKGKAEALRLSNRVASLIIAVILAVYSFLNLVIHSGLDFKRPGLRAFGYMARKHARHHSSMRAGNYASITPLPDLLFDTHE